MKPWEANIRKVVPYTPGEQPNERGMIKLNTNENPYPPAPGVQKALDAFNQDNVPVFLISLKAGGTGLNLTGADVVIHYDPWWNLAVQNQATDRAHRIGQRNTVTVYDLIAENTIEEQIKKLQESKSALAEEILSGEGIQSIVLDRDEILKML